MVCCKKQQKLLSRYIVCTIDINFIMKINYYNSFYVTMLLKLYTTITISLLSLVAVYWLLLRVSSMVAGWRLLHD